MNFSIISLLCLLFLTESLTNLPALTQVLLLSWDLYSVQSTCSPSSPPFLLATCTPPTIIPRQAGPWDPLLQCGNACSWTHLSQNNQIQRNYVGLKIIVCILTQGNSGQKMQRDQKTQLLLLKLPEQKQFTEQAPLHTIPPKGKPPSHLSSSTPQHIPIPTPYKDKLVPTLESKLPREPVVCYHSPLLQQRPQYSLA